MPRDMSSTRYLPYVMLTVLTAFVTWGQTSQYYERRIQPLRYFWADAMDEALPLQEQYGPNRFSRNREEWIARDALGDRRDGVFLDVGANHYRDESNTYYLESVLGWSGIAVEPQVEFGADYAAHRPRTKFVAMFASDVEGDQAALFVPVNQPQKLYASGDGTFVGRAGHDIKQMTVPTTTLNALLREAAIEKVDFVSMDIELAEPKALAGFDIERYRPDLVCIEALPTVRQAILDYFQRHGYVVIAKYLRADTQNLYFRPAR
jgi:FkbM family methyltransferase